jgi:D-alanine transaminase
MSRFVYVNGSYLPYHQAAIHVEDRGFQFADGVYEVISCIDGHIADERGHLDRLERSLNELQMSMPVSRQSLSILIRELLRLNRHKNGYVYIQITRGVAKRDFYFPDKNTKCSLIILSRPFNFDENYNVLEGIKVITTKDIRWKRPDIKSIALLPQVLAKQKAVESGAYESWLVDDQGYITEGASSNAWIVLDNKLITRDASGKILNGVTRSAMKKLINDNKLSIEERPFKPEEAYNAKEAFTSSATALIMPVIEIDNKIIGDGKPGKITQRLYAEYRAYVNGLRGKQVGWSAE